MGLPWYKTLPFPPYLSHVNHLEIVLDLLLVIQIHPSCVLQVRSERIGLRWARGRTSAVFSHKKEGKCKTNEQSSHFSLFLWICYVTQALYRGYSLVQSIFWNWFSLLYGQLCGSNCSFMSPCPYPHQRRLLHQAPYSVPCQEDECKDNTPIYDQEFKILCFVAASIIIPPLCKERQHRQNNERLQRQVSKPVSWRHEIHSHLKSLMWSKITFDHHSRVNPFQASQDGKICSRPCMLVTQVRFRV